MRSQRPAGIAARTGLITGLFAGVLSLPVIALSAVMRFTGGPRMFLWMFFLAVALVAFAVAGFISTRHSGLLRSGTGAGSVAALVATFIAICLGLVIVILLSAHNPIGALGVPGRLRKENVGALRFTPFRDSVIALLLLVATGPLGGFIGGLLGRLNRPARPSVAQVAPQPGPQPFQPQAPLTSPAYAGPITPNSPTIPSIPPQPFDLSSPSSPAFPD